MSVTTFPRSRKALADLPAGAAPVGAAIDRALELLISNRVRLGLDTEEAIAGFVEPLEELIRGEEVPEGVADLFRDDAAEAAPATEAAPAPAWHRRRWAPL